MKFENERHFEEYIRNLIKSGVLPYNHDLVMFESKKAVDILLCRNGKRPALFFIEVKYYRRNHGRLSTGHGKGGGFQPEVISKLPKYFEKKMRWILGSEDHEGFYLLRNSEICNYISGGAVGKKYNNLKVKLFNDEVSLSQTKLLSALREWVDEN